MIVSKLIDVGSQQMAPDQACLVLLQHSTWQKQRSMECPVFGWLRGRQTQTELPEEAHDVVSEDDLPFPINILDNTHLRGDSPKQQAIQGAADTHIFVSRLQKPHTSECNSARVGSAAATST